MTSRLGQQIGEEILAEYYYGYITYGPRNIFDSFFYYFFFFELFIFSKIYKFFPNKNSLRGLRMESVRDLEMNMRDRFDGTRINFTLDNCERC